MKLTQLLGFFAAFFILVALPVAGLFTPAEQLASYENELTGYTQEFINLQDAFVVLKGQKSTDAVLNVHTSLEELQQKVYMLDANAAKLDAGNDMSLQLKKMSLQAGILDLEQDIAVLFGHINIYLDGSLYTQQVADAKKGYFTLLSKFAALDSHLTVEIQEKNYAAVKETTMPALTELQESTSDLLNDVVLVLEGKVISKPLKDTVMWLKTRLTLLSDSISASLANAAAFLAEQNNAPVLAEIGNKNNAKEGEKILFTVSATDTDDDVLAFDAAPLPAGAQFDKQTGEFDWTPDFTQAGTYEITFSVTDSKGGEDNEKVLFTIADTNRAPVFAAVGQKNVGADALLTFPVSASDPDGDALTLSAAALPDGATFVDNKDGTGTFSWTPTSAQAGAYQATFTANDGKENGVGTLVVPINVNGAVKTAAEKVHDLEKKFEGYEDDYDDLKSELEEADDAEDAEDILDALDGLDEDLKDLKEEVKALDGEVADEELEDKLEELEEDIKDLRDDIKALIDAYKNGTLGEDAGQDTDGDTDDSGTDMTPGDGNALPNNNGGDDTEVTVIGADVGNTNTPSDNQVHDNQYGTKRPNGAFNLVLLESAVLALLVLFIVVFLVMRK